MTKQDAWILHDGKTIIEANPEFLDLFRCHERDIIDRHVEDIIADPELRALARARGRAIMANDIDRAEQEYEFLRFDGSRFWGRAISSKAGAGRYKTVIKWEYNERQ